jgi:hypothetical protein
MDRRRFLGLGRFYRRSGQRSLAREHFRLASELLREMGMQHWLERAEAELGALG